MNKLPVNTPGYYYAIAYWIASLAVILTQKERTSGWKKKLHCVFSLVILLAFMIFTQGVSNLAYAISMILIILILLGLIHFSCDLSLKESGYYCVQAFISGEFCASLCWQIYYYLVSTGRAVYTPVTQYLEMLIIFILYFMLVYFLERQLNRGMEEQVITNRHLGISILIGLTVYIVSNMSYISMNGFFSARIYVDIYIIRTVVDFAGLALLYGFHMQVKAMQIRFERDTLQGIMQMQYQSYQLSEESINIVNQKYHDLKHQLILLRENIQNPDSSEKMDEKEKEIRLSYLDQMAKEIKIYETRIKTGNKVLDAVLTSKGLICQKKEIEFKYMVDGALLSFMQDMEISALFGNMLDNAIESAEQQEDPEKRLIHLEVKKDEKRQFLRIQMENYCSEPVQFKDGMPITTKKDQNLHGYGMKSIRTTVEKYGGSAVASQDNNWFRLHIIIPISEKGRKIDPVD